MDENAPTRLFITKIDREKKIIMLDNNPPPGYESGRNVQVGDVITLNGKALRRGASFDVPIPIEIDTTMPPDEVSFQSNGVEVARIVGLQKP